MAYDEKMSKEIFLSLGSNLGDRKINILNAIELLEKYLKQEVVISSFYESKAMGFDSERDFLNICAKTKTKITPQEFIGIIHEIEHNLGRIRDEKSRYIDRIIDIDILFFGQMVVETKNLQIPHPKIYERKFVLFPLLNIAKNLVDPKSGENIETLLEACNDKSNLLLYED